MGPEEVGCAGLGRWVGWRGLGAWRESGSQCRGGSGEKREVVGQESVCQEGAGFWGQKRHR